MLRPLSAQSDLENAVFDLLSQLLVLGYDLDEAAHRLTETARAVALEMRLDLGDES